MWISLDNRKIGFIGVGVMGHHMVHNLLEKNFNVSIYARNKEKVQDLIKRNVHFYDNIKELVLNSDVIITIVGFPKDVEEIYFDEDKILNNAKKDCIVIDMTTSSPSLAEKIFEKAQEKGLHAIDCPVTGGDLGAKNGTLTMFASGDKEVFDRILPILKAMGKSICYCGKPGNGQHAKLANQIAIAGNLVAVSELYAYAKAANLDIELLLSFWQSGSAGSFQMNTSFVSALKNNFEPGFYTKHFIKDMKLALEESNKNDLDLKMLNLVYKMYLDLQDKGYENKGTQIITKYYEKE